MYLFLFSYSLLYEHHRLIILRILDKVSQPSYLLEDSPAFLRLGKKDCPSFRRILILLFMINIISLKAQGCDHHFLHNYIECLRMYFHIVPDPYPTYEEVKRLLVGYLGEINELRFLEPFCTDLERYFPESLNHHQPRSLTHLSRCVVRETLRKYGPLPTIVNSLSLPKIIKEYLVCKRN